MKYLALILLLAGCSSVKELPKQPDAPTDGAVVETIGKELDKTDSRVGAAIVVAVENLDKPAVAKAELGVASSYLPAPLEGDVAFARQTSVLPTLKKKSSRLRRMPPRTSGLSLGLAWWSLVALPVPLPPSESASPSSWLEPSQGPSHLLSTALILIT